MKGFQLPRQIKKLRAKTAVTGAHLATFASRATGRGAGGMIGGLVARAIDPSIMTQLAGDRPAVIVTGTNGKIHHHAHACGGDAQQVFHRYQ